MTNDNQDNTPNDPDAGAPADASGATSPAIAPAVEPPARSRARWIAAAGAALAVALFAVPLLRGPEDHVPGAAGEPSAGGAATGASCAVNKGAANLDFTLKDVNGGDVRLGDFKGKVILLNFWATWCGPCKVEIPEFVDAYNKYRDRGFVILGVLSEDDPSAQDLRSFAGDFKMNYPVLRPSQELEAAFGTLYALPTSFFIDRQGSICTKHMGPVSKEMLEREIKGLL